MTARRPILAGAVTWCAVVSALVFGGAPALGDHAYKAAGTFGEACTATPCAGGQFTEPSGVAANTGAESVSEPAGGDVYVIDAGDARVERFDAAGTYLSQFDGGETPAKSFSFRATQSANGIAVDNSHSALDPSAGDVYVIDLGAKAIDKFTATGTYVSQITGTPSEAFGELDGVAVDPSGNVWVREENANVDEFGDTGAFVSQFNKGRFVLPGFAVDSKDDQYVVFGTEAAGKYENQAEVAEFSSGTTAIAVDPATDHVLVDKGGSIDLYPPFAEPSVNPLQTFPSSGFGESHGLAVGAESEAYASQLGTDDVAMFHYGLVFVVTTTSAVSSETGGVLHGTISTARKAVTDCRFEYGIEEGSYTQSVPCAQSPAQITTAGETSESVPVSASVSGLDPRTTYHFRLGATGAEGSLSGEDGHFYTAAAPIVEGEESSDLRSTSAELSARIGAEGIPTTYRVEYGTGTVGESSTSEVSIGAPSGVVGVVVQVSGLAPGREYLYRFVASNASGQTDGAEMTFRTGTASGPSALVLPDDRAYELVSSPEGPGEAYVPEQAVGSAGVVDIVTGVGVLFRASVDGDRVVYAGDPAATGGSGGIGKGQGDQLMSARGPDGWSASDIEPPGTRTNNGYEGFEAFSDDLSVGFIRARNEPPAVPSLTADAPQCGGVDLYTAISEHSPAENPYTPLLAESDASGACGLPTFAGASADNSHVLFQDEAALVPGAPKAGGSGYLGVCEYHCDLYDSVGGHLSLVNELPDGEADPNAVFGSAAAEGHERSDFSNVISADGSRIFWTDLNTGLIYVRENDARSIQVSAGPGTYWTASHDGRYVLYTEDGSLWRFDVDKFNGYRGPEAEALAQAREEIASSAAGVQGVIGISEDGSHVYFVAEGALAGHAEKRLCKTAAESRGEALRLWEENKITFEEFQAISEPSFPEGREEQEGLLPAGRGCNVYLAHDGSTTFVTALAASDGNNLTGLYVAGREPGGDWQSSPAYRVAAVTPDGGRLLFESTMARSITGYDNRVPFPLGVRPEQEIFVFDAGSDGLWCASCAPSEEPPRPEERYETGTFIPVDGHSTYTPRWMSNDGNRVFFDTDQSLVAQDTNGAQDVYEWEREGTSGCGVSVPARPRGGCLFLLSGGSSSDLSWLVDASGSGDDLFIVTRAQLVPADQNEKMDVYDARVGGGFAQVEHACTGTGCQGVPPAPPIFATPSSVTFSGVGNFQVLAKPPARPKQKRRGKRSKCKKGSVKRHSRCVRGSAKKSKGSVRRSNGRSK